MPKQVHVLVADATRIRNMLRRYLTDEGLSVSEASDGDAMRQMLAREAVDIVLLDLVMLGEGGLSLHVTSAKTRRSRSSCGRATAT
jgi:DNA-binding response OmpR family regulator